MFGRCVDVRAEARTYLRCNSNSEGNTNGKSEDRGKSQYRGLSAALRFGRDDVMMGEKNGRSLREREASSSLRSE